MVRTISLIMAVLTLILTSPASHADPPEGVGVSSRTAAITDTASRDPAAVEALIETLEDDAERARLVENLRLLLPAQPTEAVQDPSLIEAVSIVFLERLNTHLDTLEQQGLIFVAAYRDLPAIGFRINQILFEETVRDYWAHVLVSVLAVLGVAILARLGTRYATRRPLRRLETVVPTNAFSRATAIFVHALLDLLPTVMFAIVAYAGISRLQDDLHAQPIAFVLVNSSIVANLIDVALRLLLMPRAPGLRLIRLPSESAAYLKVWTRRLTLVTVYGVALCYIADILAISEPATEALQNLVGLVLTGLLIVLTLQNRQAVAAWIRSDDDTSLFARPVEQGPPVAPAQPAGDAGAVSSDGAVEENAEREEVVSSQMIEERIEVKAMSRVRNQLAGVWHVLAIIYFVVCYGILLLDFHEGLQRVVEATLASLALVALARSVQFVLDRLIRRGFSVSENLEAQYPGLEARANRYVPLLHRTLVAIAWVAAVLMIGDAWDLRVLDAAQSELGRRIVARVTSVLIVVVVAVAVWELISMMIEHYLAGADQAGVRVERSARVRTLLPMLRNGLWFTLVAITVLVVLTEIGVDTTPLIAGAGVVGLAIGFGAQTLAKDIITGIFILAEDSIAVGDVVEVGGHGGLVEQMTIRTIKLRDLSGNVHTVPFSDVTSVKNYTKDFSYYLIDMGIAYREDCDEVMRVMKEVGSDLQKDRDLGPEILEPIEMLGVDAFADSAVVIKARIRTRPIKQWAVGREYLRRLKKRFDELGIEIPFPHTTIYFGVDKEGKAPPAPVSLLQSRIDAGADPADLLAKTAPAAAS